MNSSRDRAIELNIEVNILRDFIEWLFNQDEYLSDASHSEAWSKFESYQESETNTLTPPAAENDK